MSIFLKVMSSTNGNTHSLLSTGPGNTRAGTITSPILGTFLPLSIQCCQVRGFPAQLVLFWTFAAGNCEKGLVFGYMWAIFNTAAILGYRGF